MCTSLLLTAKCTSAPLGKRQQRLGGLALRARRRSKRYWSMASPMLWVKSVFSSDRGDRHAVEEQHQVDAVLVVQRVAHLPHHPQPVGGVAREDVRVDGQRRLELGQLERLLAARAARCRGAARPACRAGRADRAGGRAASRRPARRGSSRGSPTPSAAWPAPTPARRPGTAPARGRSRPQSPSA